jgi:hypothetical protein
MFQKIIQYPLGNRSRQNQAAFGQWGLQATFWQMLGNTAKPLDK